MSSKQAFTNNMQSKLAKSLLKLNNKLDRMKRRRSKTDSLPKNVIDLLESARQGDCSKCVNLLSSGTDVNSRGTNNETALCLAAGNGHVELLPLLLSRHVDVNAQDEDGDTALMYALMAGKLAFVRTLLEQCGNRIDCNLKNNRGKSVIEKAFKMGNEEAVRLLDEKGAMFTCNEEKHKKVLFRFATEGSLFLIRFWFSHHAQRNVAINMASGSRTLTFVAARSGHHKIIEFLSSEGADLDLPDEYGNTPLFCAAQNGFSDIVEFLVSNGCQLNHKNRAGRTPIFSALRNGHFDIVRSLQNHGADLSVRDKKRFSLLHMAITAGSKEIFEYLCSHLINDDEKLNAATKDGETCLLTASQTRHLEIFKILVDKKVDLNHRNKLGVSAALRAAHNDQEEMVQLLYERGAELDLPNRKNETALLCAAKKNNLSLVRLLIDTKKCDISVQDCNCQTLAYCAVENKNFEMLRLLIDSGAPLDVANNSGNTPFIVAVAKNCIEAVQLLAESGKVDLDRRNRKGHSAVLLAVNNESMEVLQYLLGRNCELDVSDRDGDTPFLLAIKKGNYKIAKLLTSRTQPEIDVNAADKTGNTCLHVASRSNTSGLLPPGMDKRNPAFVTLLSNKGANLDATDNEGNTPFAVSAKKGNLSALPVLAAKGCDANRCNKTGQNAAHLCISSHSSVLVNLEAMRCQLDMEDADGNAPIHLAAKKGDSPALEFLIECGVPIDLPNKQGDTPVHLACGSDSSEALECLLEAKAALKVTNNARQTQLMLASKKGKKKTVEILLSKYNADDISQQDSCGKTALHYALEFDHHKIAQLLVEKGADLNTPDNDGFTPCLLAAKKNLWNVLGSALLAPVHLQKTKNGESLAHIAACGANLEMLQRLKKLGLSLMDLTSDGDSCLTLAAAHGSVQVCDFLIDDEGNSISHCNGKGESAICRAAQNGHSDLFYSLAYRGADFLQRDRSGICSLYYLLHREKSLDFAAVSQLLRAANEADFADLNSKGFSLCHMASKKGSVKLLKDLHKRGWDLSKKTQEGDSCITLATGADGSETLKFLLGLELKQANEQRQEKHEVLKRQLEQEMTRALFTCAQLGKTDSMGELINSGANPNAEDAEGNTALIIACQHKQQEFAISLINRDAQPPIDVNRVNQDGLSALHFASRHQMADCVELLLSHDAKTDVKSSSGFTCLHEAVNSSDTTTDVAEMLINAGCDINAKTTDGEGCIIMALKNGSWELIQLLKSRGATLDIDKIPASLVIRKLLSRGRIDTVTWLLDQGLNVNRRDGGHRHVLFDVIDFGDVDLLRLFIRKGADLECEEKNGITPFLYAIIRGREDLAHVLLDSGCNAEKKTSDGLDCVMLAVTAKRLYTVKWLLRTLPNRPPVDIEGKTAVHICAMLGHPQIFEVLCSSGYELTRKCKLGLTPVDYATANGHLAVIKIAEKMDRTFVIRVIKESAAKPANHPLAVTTAAEQGYQNIFEFYRSIGVNFEKMSAPFLSACYNAQQHIVKLFASVESDVVEYRDAETGKNPLQFAIYSGNLHLVQFLVEKIGCDLKAVCYNRNSIIQAAITANQERILKYLICKGAPVDKEDAEGDTPVLEAAYHCHLSMLQILLDQNCDIQKANNQGRNAAHVAVMKTDSLEMVKFLMAKGVPVNCKDKQGNTPVMIASFQGHHGAVEFLLQCHPSSGKERNNDGSTPALLAAMQGKHEVLRVLADKDCLTDDADKDGSTALMLAIQSGSVPTVRKLLETGTCNLTAVNNSGIDVKSLAMRCRDAAMLQLMREYRILDDAEIPAATGGSQTAVTESVANESAEVHRIGYPIELLPFTPDRPPPQISDADQQELYDEVDYAASEIHPPSGSDGASQPSVLADLRHNPDSVSDGGRRGPRSILSQMWHPARSVAASSLFPPAQQWPRAGQPIVDELSIHSAEQVDN